MMELLLCLILLIGVGLSLWSHYRRKPFDPHLPPPNWRCSRGGKDYF